MAQTQKKKPCLPVGIRVLKTLSKLLPGFGQVHRHTNSWPWNPMGTCISGLGCVQVFRVDRAEWLSPVFILDSQSSPENRYSSVCSLRAKPSWHFWGIPSYLYMSLTENAMVAAALAPFFSLCIACNTRSPKLSIEIVKVFMSLVRYSTKWLAQCPIIFYLQELMDWQDVDFWSVLSISDHVVSD